MLYYAPLWMRRVVAQLATKLSLQVNFQRPQKSALRIVASTHTARRARQLNIASGMRKIACWWHRINTHHLIRNSAGNAGSLSILLTLGDVKLIWTGLIRNVRPVPAITPNALATQRSDSGTLPVAEQISGRPIDYAQTNTKTCWSDKMSAARSVKRRFASLPMSIMITIPETFAVFSAIDAINSWLLWTRKVLSGWLQTREAILIRPVNICGPFKNVVHGRVINNLFSGGV